jgi:hypothetical protein
VGLNYGTMQAVVFDSPQASCDLCGKAFESPALFSGARITLEVSDPYEFMMGQGLRTRLLPAYGHNSLARDMNLAGWTSEVVRGKQLIVCPSHVEPAPPDSAETSGEAKP